ncbi:MAG: type VI secretion system protein TssL, long form [Burkholderiales bacterium]|nr:type VI secretion system protein TssL, long form [Burkholderiales bacterium]
MSDQDPKPDPFAAFESDRTVIKPSAGRGPRAPAAPAAPAAAASGWAPAADAGVGDLPAYASLNPLVQAAAPLLAAAPRLRAMVRHPNPQALRASLAESVRRFEAAARAQNLPNEQVVAARYILCTLLDESASSTPWGGEKVFQLLSRLAENPAQNRNLLELVWVALSLGFEGRYRVLDNGRQQLDSVRERLAQMLRQQSGPSDKTLSTQWQGVAAAPQRLRDGVPMWVLAAAAALLLMLVFIGLRIATNVQTDATFSALQTLDAKAAVAPPAPPPAVPAPAPPPRLAQLLKTDIGAGSVQVRDLADSSIVTLHGDSLFDPGSAQVAARAVPLFQRIAAALNQVPGKVLISGHTDNVPIRTLRFPSNWHLSKARAEAVRDLLAATVKPDRLTAEGRADTEPVADNATPEGRAKNRRVEITLSVAAAK